MSNNTMSAVIPHYFKGNVIYQASATVEISDIQIPASYSNASHICKANGKLWADYKRLKSTKAYWEALALDMGIAISRLVIEIEGRPEGDASLQGTWTHPNITMDLAQWVNIEFRIWANKTLNAVVNGDFAPLTAEAELVQQKLQELWLEMRSASKAAFWTLSDATKLYIESNPNVSDNYKRFIYSNCQDTVNRGILGKMAKKIRAEIDTSGLLRDNYTVEALERIKTVQRLAAIQVTNKEIEPLQAVRNALEFCGYEVIEYN